jgi:acetyl esterase/lipase
MRLTDSLKISPDNIIVMGDSAGGSLAIALSMYLRDNGYRLPRALVVMSPWVDMTMSCGSWDENSKYDVIPMPDSDGESCSRLLESHYSFSKAESVSDSCRSPQPNSVLHGTGRNESEGSRRGSVPSWISG